MGSVGMGQYVFSHLLLLACVSILLSCGGGEFSDFCDRAFDCRPDSEQEIIRRFECEDVVEEDLRWRVETGEATENQADQCRALLKAAGEDDSCGTYDALRDDRDNICLTTFFMDNLF